MLAFRLVLLLIGVASCAVGVSGLTKLFGETVDSPRWMLAALVVLAFVTGATAIVFALGGASRSRQR